MSHLAALASVLVWALVGRSGATYELTGTVHQSLDGMPVPDVAVTLIDDTGKEVGRAHTDVAGRFRIVLGVVTAVDAAAEPIAFQLGLPYPNPFNPTARIPLAVGASTAGSVRVYNSAGQRVRTLVDGHLDAGAREIEWDGRDDRGRPLAAGIYLVHVSTPNGARSGRLTLVDGTRPASPAGRRTAVDPPGRRIAVELADLAGHALVLSEGGIRPRTVPITTAADTQLTVEAGVLEHTLPIGGTLDLLGVPGGAFRMGSDRYEDERPVHDVVLGAFYLTRTEVTVADYAACASAGACAPAATGEACNGSEAERGSHPANCVSWYDAHTFCDWAGLRLPTEAEWEKAARGTHGRRYPWGDEPPGGAGDCERAVMMRAGLGLGCGHIGTAPVAGRSQDAGPYGHRDLAGNVWEWTLDWYDPHYYLRSPATAPRNDMPTPFRSVRGNSWYYVDPDPDMRAANRFGFRPMRWVPYVGFRCAASAGDVPAPPAPVESPTSMTAALAPADWWQRNQVARALEGDIVPARQPPTDADVVSVPGGMVTMGSLDGDSDERPVIDVWVDAFHIDRHEVTVAQYRRCVEAASCTEANSGSRAYRLDFEAHYLNWGQPGRDAHPVNGISWYQASDYCAWAGKRLPTEAEWERAARGDDGRVYPWGDEEPSCARAILDEGGDGCGQEMPWPVGSRPAGASPFGVLDLAGNVWEWTADWYDRRYYEHAPGRNPRNDDPTGGRKVLRGGSMADQNPRIHRAANRLGYDPAQGFDYTIGFRCARDGA